MRVDRIFNILCLYVVLALSDCGVASAADADRDVKFLDGGPPIYPQYCLEEKLQGHVDLMFVVDVNGMVKDPIVLDTVVHRGNPEEPIKDDEAARGFVWAAKSALKNFRYEPRVVDGERVEKKGVKTKISFALE